MNTVVHVAPAARRDTRIALWLLPVFAAWVLGFIVLGPEGYLEDWLPWLGAMLLSILPVVIGLVFAIRGLRMGDRLAWVPVVAYSVLLALFGILPLVQRFTT